jgi:hypothetical protein
MKTMMMLPRDGMQVRGSCVCSYWKAAARSSLSRKSFCTCLSRMMHGRMPFSTPPAEPLVSSVAPESHGVRACASDDDDDGPDSDCRHATRDGAQRGEGHKGATMVRVKATGGLSSDRWRWEITLPGYLRMHCPLRVAGRLLRMLVLTCVVAALVAGACVGGGVGGGGKSGGSWSCSPRAASHSASIAT